MKKVLIFLFLVISMGISAQPLAYQSGERTVSLVINPIFSYAGNFFSGNENFTNQFVIPISGNFVYRHFVETSRATRHEFDLFFDQSTTGSVTNGTSQNTVNFTAYYMWGREKHIYLSKFNVYSFYGLGPGLSYSSSVIENFNEPPFEKVTSIQGPSVSALASAGIGIEYRFSPRFFIGVEVAALGRLSYSVSDKNERVDKISGNIQTNETRNVVNAQIGIANPMTVRAGVRF